MPSLATVPAERADHSLTADEHLTLDETAKWLRCSTRTLQRLLEVGEGPPVIRLSQRRVIFRLTDLRTWLAHRTRGATEVAQPRHGGLPPSDRAANK